MNNCFLSNILIGIIVLTLSGCPPKPNPDEDITVFIGGMDSTMYAFDVKSTNIKWSFKTNGVLSSIPLIYNDAIYFGSMDSFFYAIDTSKGNVKWIYKTNGGILSCPYVENKTIYFGSSDNSIYSIDAITGKLNWTFKTNFFAGNSPIVYDSVLYFCSSDQYVYAINTNNGNLKWKFLTNKMISSGPSIADNLLLFGSIEKKIYALDIFTGDLKWTVNTNAGIQESPTINNKMLYVGDVEGYLYAIDIKNEGNLIWVDTLINEFGYLLSPIIRENIVYTAGGSRIIALNAINKNHIWINRQLATVPRGFISSGPTVTENFVYVGAGNGKMYSISIQNGIIKDSFNTKASQYSINGMISAGPLVVTKERKVYYPGRSGLAW